ncbi:MAG: hypothetical protein EPO29_00290, partial [Betaproteobacteria bacterium]
LPEAARTLLDCHALRILARPIGVARIDATHEVLRLQFQKDPPLEPQRIVDLVRRRRNLRLAGPDRLHLEAKLPSWPERVQAARELMQQLAA